MVFPKPLGWSETQAAHAFLIPTEMVGQLVAKRPLDLAGQKIPIVAEVPLKRVAIDDDPVLVAFSRNPVSEVLAVGMHLLAAIGNHDGDLRQHLLEFIRQPIDRIDDQRLELVEVRRIRHV